MAVSSQFRDVHGFAVPEVPVADDNGGMAGHSRIDSQAAYGPVHM